MYLAQYHSSTTLHMQGENFFEYFSSVNKPQSRWSWLVAWNHTPAKTQLRSEERARVFCRNNFQIPCSAVVANPGSHFSVTAMVYWTRTTFQLFPQLYCAVVCAVFVAAMNVVHVHSPLSLQIAKFWQVTPFQSKFWLVYKILRERYIFAGNAEFRIFSRNFTSKIFPLSIPPVDC